jgi:hypothetical protein
MLPPPVTARQSRLAEHWLAAAPWQHACPDPPHAVHIAPTQRAPLAVQKSAAAPPPAAPPGQQAWASAPHGVPAAVLHEPFVHRPLTPVPAHACPAPTHDRVVCPPAAAEAIQQPPLVHEFPPQHGCPGPPH